MLLRRHLLIPHRRPRRGVILLVVLALLTLFAGVGIAFVYFSESEANAAANVKQSETVRLPDPDLLFQSVMRQITYPTNNNNSALYTQSLMENLYGRGGRTPYNGTGRIERMYRDPRWPTIRDGMIGREKWLNTLLEYPGKGADLSAIGQDELYRINKQYQTYHEYTHGSLNPSYTYPDHKNPYLGVVVGNYLDRAGNSHGPTAIARSFAREMKFRIVQYDPGRPLTMPNVVGYHDVVINPYSCADYDFWLATKSRNGMVWLPLGDLPQPRPPEKRIAYGTNSVIDCALLGQNASLTLDAATVLAHTMRPHFTRHPNFPPPTDFGGDVKNLPPEVKTLVGYDGDTPVFAQNDSYWVDFGFPALPWTGTRKVKPLAAVFIMSNDGKVNLNVHGNLRGLVKGEDPRTTTHLSGHGIGPWEVNPLLLGRPSGGSSPADNVEYQNLHAGRGIIDQARVERGRQGYAPDRDPTMYVDGYRPLLRSAPFYSTYNFDGSTDQMSATSTPATGQYSPSFPINLPGDHRRATTDPAVPFSALERFPFGMPNTLGYNNGDASEWERNAQPRHGIFRTPFAPGIPTVKYDRREVLPHGRQIPYDATMVSDEAGSTQRTFGLHNLEVLYRANDTGADRFDSDLRRLVPTLFASPSRRWMNTLHSFDLASPGVAPWYQRDPLQSPGTGRHIPYTYIGYPPNNPGPGADYDTAPGRPAGSPLSLPWLPPTTQFPPGSGQNGEYRMQGHLWRSIFGDEDRIDLARQLPDYPLPATANSQYDPTNATVIARYRIALHARQKLAEQIHAKLRDLCHPPPPKLSKTLPMVPLADPADRWLAQLAVNIVDYIDNDDLHTWYQINVGAGAPVDPRNIVWGTELPRVVINEVYAEARNSPGGRDKSYLVDHWVELYNPLRDGNYSDAWPADVPSSANARLNVAGWSAYRLVITNHTNVKDMRANPENSLGYPDNTNPPDPGADPPDPGRNPPAGSDPTRVNIVTFPPGVAVLPSNSNFGTSTRGSPGFFVVGPADEGTPVNPFGSAPDAFQPDYSSPEMRQQKRIVATDGNFNAADSQNVHKQAILLQRLANPYLPYNPLPNMAAPANQWLFADDKPKVEQPYNPYITIDYVDRVHVHSAVLQDRDGGDNQVDPLNQRRSFGKYQPYAGAELFMMPQRPDNDNTRAGVQEYFDRPQHTFHRHNSVEGTIPFVPSPGPQPDTSGAWHVNTLRMPFEWLVHLDRAPLSPAELLHVSGFRQHELTQQFNQSAKLENATILSPRDFPPTIVPTSTLARGTLIRFGGKFIGELHGRPFALRPFDMVQVTLCNPEETRFETDWVLVRTVAPDYSWFEAINGTTLVGNYLSQVKMQLIIPYSHYAPWFRAGQPTGSQSNNRIYRLLETVAVRNPGAEVGQFRFEAQTSNISPPLPDGSRWIQFTKPPFGRPPVPQPAAETFITTNDGYVRLNAADTASLGWHAPTPQIGDVLVAYAGQVDNAIMPPRSLEQRVAVLEVDWQNNRLRTVLDPATDPALNPDLTLDLTYLAGRQPGKININEVWDEDVFRAMVDVQPMNRFWTGALPHNTSVPYDAGYDRWASRVFSRLVQQRQPAFWSSNRLPGQTGDRPFEGFGSGPIPPNEGNPAKGVGRTFLSQRYSEGGALAFEAADARTDLLSLFEVNDLPPIPSAGGAVNDTGLDHPYRRFEMLGKLWNNMTVRSNTFTVWITVGFFEFDDVTGLGPEINHLTGRNVRHRFFAVVDRTSIDSWMKHRMRFDVGAGIEQFANFPTLDPRNYTYTEQFVVSTVYGQLPSTTDPPGEASLPGVWQITPAPGVPASAVEALNRPGRVVEVSSRAGTERAVILSIDPAASPPLNIVNPPERLLPSNLYARLTLNHPRGEILTLRPLPVPPVVLYWSQIK